eukprot:scaffold910_cov396-Prasinococcus_capsulatus_cf.AAC.76
MLCAPARSSLACLRQPQAWPRASFAQQRFPVGVVSFPETPAGLLGHVPGAAYEPLHLGHCRRTLPRRWMLSSFPGLAGGDRLHEEHHSHCLKAVAAEPSP